MLEKLIDPPAVETVNPAGRSPYVLLCEHASNHMPARCEGLGLDAGELQRHIAWDIGVAPIARQLSQALDAPLVLSGYSRLLISPGVAVNVNNWKLYADVEVPLYQHVNGDQLIGPEAVKIVASYSF